MEQLCARSPVPIAFDEELIGYTGEESMEQLLLRMRPKFIVLKPTLHGGLSGCSSWINIAEKYGIGWWITSALESSIGLNAICQFTANYPIAIPQGLGTGAIYQYNFDSPLRVKNGTIFLDASQPWDLHELR
jgi:o-succinylbenzoate synthase